MPLSLCTLKGEADPMVGTPEGSRLSSSRAPLQLIMVIEHDEQIGTRLVQMIRHETPFQAILATSLREAHSILQHLACDFFLLADDTFPQKELERLSVPSVSGPPPTLLNLTSHSSTYDYRDEHDLKSIIRAVNLLLSVCCASRC